MGQYYKAIVLNKTWRKAKNPIKVAITSWDYNNGSKLMEHSYIGNEYVRVAENMLISDYYGYPFVWCGDYADCVKINGNDVDIYGESDNKIIQPKYNNEVGFDKMPFDCYILVNLDKKEYVDLRRFYIRANKSENGGYSNLATFVIHPLPLLCCNSNGRGGGDYHGTQEDIVGRWAYDRIGIQKDIPQGFVEINVDFKEEY